MLEASCKSSFLRQAAWLSGNHATARRESRGPDLGDELFEEVSLLLLRPPFPDE